jgi:recombinational DNA repair protein (RecF pathway)
MIDDMGEIETARCSRCRRDVDVRTTVIVRGAFICDDCMEPQREATIPILPELDRDYIPDRVARALLGSTQPEAEPESEWEAG